MHCSLQRYNNLEGQLACSQTLQLKHVLPVVVRKVTGTLHSFFTAPEMTQAVGRRVGLTRVSLNTERKFYNLVVLTFCLPPLCKHTNLRPTVRSPGFKLRFRGAQAGERGKGKASSLPCPVHKHKNLSLAPKRAPWALPLIISRGPVCGVVVGTPGVTSLLTARRSFLAPVKANGGKPRAC